MPGLVAEGVAEGHPGGQSGLRLSCGALGDWRSQSLSPQLGRTSYNLSAHQGAAGDPL